MKQTIFGLLLFTSVLAITSCKEKSVEHEPADLAQVLHNADSAKQDIAYFDTICAALTTPDSISANGSVNAPIKGFTVRAIDLLTAMGMQPAEAPNLPYDHIRVYLGFNKAAGKFKLYIVPVGNASLSGADPQSGTDILLDTQGNGIPPQPGAYPPDYLNNKFVLDLNAPCPNLCDVNTPLISNNQ